MPKVEGQGEGSPFPLLPAYLPWALVSPGESSDPGPLRKPDLND